MAGKPKKDWHDYVNIICEQLASKKGTINACKSAGISHSTHYDWIERFPEYATRIKKAELSGESFGKEYAIQAIFAAMGKSWQAAAWWLERKYPDEFGKKADFNIENSQSSPIKVCFETVGNKKPEDNKPAE